VDRAAGGRRIALEGRAFFAVAEDRSVPFVVHAGIGEIVVLGTWFQVDARPDELGVLVIDGRVKLETAAGEVEIDPGQRSRAVLGAAPYVEELIELRPELAWMEGLLVFHDTPFDQAVTAIEDRYGVTFQLENESVGERTISASFTTEGLETVLSVVCRVIDVSCSLEGSVVRVFE
jgi:ferric-dicitrate binding protein FerR (iron transport regulator)